MLKKSATFFVILFIFLNTNLYAQTIEEFNWDKQAPLTETEIKNYVEALAKTIKNTNTNNASDLENFYYNLRNNANMNTEAERFKYIALKVQAFIQRPGFLGQKYVLNDERERPTEEEAKILEHFYEELNMLLIERDNLFKNSIK